MYLELLVNDVLNTIKPTISIREAISHQRRAGEEGEGEEGRNHHQLLEGEGEGDLKGIGQSQRWMDRCRCTRGGRGMILGYKKKNRC